MLEVKKKYGINMINSTSETSSRFCIPKKNRSEKTLVASRHTERKGIIANSFEEYVNKGTENPTLSCTFSYNKIAISRIKIKLHTIITKLQISIVIFHFQQR